MIDFYPVIFGIEAVETKSGLTAKGHGFYCRKRVLIHSICLDPTLPTVPVLFISCDKKPLANSSLREGIIYLAYTSSLVHP